MDMVVSGHRSSGFTSHERRRGAPGRRVAVDRVAGAVRQVGGPHLGAHRGGRAPGRRRARLPAQRGRARPADGDGADGRPRGHRRDAPVLRAGAARRPGRGVARRLRGRAGRRRQRPRPRAGLVRGPARRAGRRLPVLHRRPARVVRRARRDARGRRRRACRSCASTPSAGPSSRCATCSSSGTRGSATWAPSSTPRPSGCGARRCCACSARPGSSPARTRGRRSGSTRPSAPALALLDAPERPTAIYCDDDLLAGGVYLAARERGLRIPEDLSVVGFDDLPFARVFDPPLTTIRIDPEALGGEAFELLAALMAGEPAPPGRILPVELVTRESTAPPPKGAWPP